MSSPGSISPGSVTPTRAGLDRSVIWTLVDEYKTLLEQCTGIVVDAATPLANSITLAGLESVPHEALALFAHNVNRIVGKLEAFSASDRRETLPAIALPNAFGNGHGMSDPSLRLSDALLTTSDIGQVTSGAYTMEKSMENMYASTVFTKKVLKKQEDDGFKKINTYLVLEELGRGSFGKVKLAADTANDDKMVAIKIIPRDTIVRRLQTEHRNRERRRSSAAVGKSAQLSLSSDPNNLIKSPRSTDLDVTTLQEVAVMKRLKHPNVVRLYEVIDDPEKNKVYFVMQYIDRGPLLNFDSSFRSRPLDLDVAAQYMKQLLAAMSYLHSRNIVHRDIKPDNILLSASGRVYLSDFGVSDVCEMDTEGFADGDGTPMFQPPEILAGVEDFDAKAADVWSLGITFFVMVFGRLPWQGENMAVLLEQIRKHSIHQVIEEVSDEDDDGVIPGMDLGNTTTTIDEMMSMTSRQLATEEISDAEIYHAKLKGAVCELLKGMLHTDPKARFTIKKCRRSRVVKGVDADVAVLMSPRTSQDIPALSPHVRRPSAMVMLPEPPRSGGENGSPRGRLSLSLPAGLDSALSRPGLDSAGLDGGAPLTVDETQPNMSPTTPSSSPTRNRLRRGHLFADDTVKESFDIPEEEVSRAVSRCESGLEDVVQEQELVRVVSKLNMARPYRSRNASPVPQ